MRLAPGPGCCSETAEDRVEGIRHPRQTGPIFTGEDTDATQEWKHGRETDACADALRTRGGRPDQVTDPSGEQFEVLLADARTLGARIALGAGHDRDQPKRAVRVQTVSRRHAAQSGFAHGVVGDHAEEFLERSPTGLHRAGEDVALGDPIAVGDGERGEFVPQEEEAAERGEEARVQLARLDRSDALPPDQAPRDCVAVLQRHERAVGPRRDRSRSPLDRHDRLEVQRSLCLERLRLDQQVGERVGLDETAWRPGPLGRLETGQLRLDRCGGRGFGPSCPLIAMVPMKTLRRTSSIGSPSSAATAAANSSAPGSMRRIAFHRSSFGSMGTSSRIEAVWRCCADAART